jgi:DnaJ family protein A protein 2
VRIKIKRHELFQRRGADLVIVKKITLLEALTGVTMEIKHLDGKKHIIATAPGEVLNHEELKTVRGLGLPYYKDPMSHGHLYVEFLITYPKKGSINAANLEKIAKILNSKIVKTDGYSKTSKNKILEEFRDSDTNSHPQGGDSREYE